MSKKGKIICTVIVVLCAVLLVSVYFVFGGNDASSPAETPDNTQQEEQQEAAAKNITVSVVGLGGETTSYELETKAAVLSQAMKEAEGLTFSGSEGPYGIMLEEVNGVRAVYEEDGAYWSVLVDGEYGMHGIDTQPVEDGTVYSLVYTLA